MIGTVLDKYEVLQKVGEGGMATVYRGRHTTLDRNVAIKVLHPHLSSSTRNRRRFAREARAIEHLRHDNILEIFDYSGTDSHDCYIITEFVTGQTLTALMDHVGRVPSEVVAKIGIDLCEALAYAHDSGILHRDLKPDNVMVRADGRVKLMDFGIARFLDESQVTMTGALVGSPAFMSPEQAKEEDLDQRSDLFSLGTLLFYLVTGSFPFSGSNPSLILKNIIEGNRPAPSELAPAMSARLSDTIDTLLEPDRDARFASAADAAISLRQCLEEVHVTDDEAWSVYRYVSDPEAYTARLTTHLKTHLIDNGRALMAQGAPLAALRLYNRLLSIDEDNAEVLALIEGISTTPVHRRRGVLIGGAFAVVTVAVAASVGYTYAQREPATPPAPPHALAANPPLDLPAAPKPPPSGVPPSPVPDLQPEAPSVEPTVAPRGLTAPRPSPVRATPRSTAVAIGTVPSPPAPLGAPPTMPVVVAPGEVILNSGEFPADVFEAEQKIGFTRQPAPLLLSPGVHRLVLRSPGTLDQEVEVTVSSGERLQIPVSLLPRPVVVFVPPTFAGTCLANRNGEHLGPVEGLSRNIVLDRPDRDNLVVLDCGGDDVFRMSVRDPRALNVVFAADP